MMNFRNKVFLLLAMGLMAFSTDRHDISNRIVSYTVDPRLQDIALYWKDDKGKIIGSIKNLKHVVESKNRQLVFAANGGMFNADTVPQGLFVQHFKTLRPLDKSSGNGNFYLKPNGVFYITADNRAMVCKTEDFRDNAQIKFATQSGPMLVIDGQIHAAFRNESTNLHIRNGVGILPDGKVVFAMSKVRVNFYDLASYFLSLGCKNALYLDGFVSRTYLPEQNWVQTDGSFGVIVGVTKPAGK